MALNTDNHSKGFAFIEFEDEVGLVSSLALLVAYLLLIPTQKDAARALGANNYELKKRRIAVTQSDSRVRSQKR